METIKEFFKHINYRLSSPFIFSFIISWLVCNWRVTIGLLFQNPEFLKVDGYSSYINLVAKNVTTYTGIVLPLIGAIIYTVFNPILSILIQAFQIYFQKVGDDWNMSILKESKIGIEKYISLKRGLDERKKILEEVIKNESEMFLKLEEQRNETFKLQSELALSNSKIAENEARLKYKNFFQIFNKASGKVIDVPYQSTSDGDLVHLMFLNNGENQIWEIRVIRDNLCSIVNMHSKKCLEVQQASKANSALIQQRNFDGKLNQLWEITLNTDGYYSIKPYHSGKYLEQDAQTVAKTNEPGKLIQHEEMPGDHQKWILAPIDFN